MTVLAPKINPMWYGAAGLAVVGLGVGVYWMFFKHSNPLANGSTTGNGKGTSGLCQHTNYPVRPGSCGAHVKPLQRYINSKIRPPLRDLEVDGKYGKNTEKFANQYLGKNTFSKSFMESLPIQFK